MKLSILMPVFNADKYLDLAINSIISQSYKAFEFIIIDDGSTDRSKHIIRNTNDSRLVVLENPTNQGIIASLNKGIDFAKGEYIMRMDADDISSQTRAYEQLNFLEKNPSISACGTWVKTIGGVINRVRKYPCDPNYIKCHLLFETPIVHPTVMYRKQDLIAHNLFYDSNYPHAEDFELWSRLCNVSSFANINEVLLGYRLNTSGISYQNSQAQLLMKKKIVKNIFSYLHYEPSEQELALHFTVILGNMKQYLEQIIDLESWFCKIIALNNNSQYYDNNILIDVLKQKWMQVFLINLNYGPKAWEKFSSSIFFDKRTSFSSIIYNGIYSQIKQMRYLKTHQWGSTF